MPVDFYLIGKMVLTALALGLATVLIILTTMSFKLKASLIEAEQFIRSDLHKAYNIGTSTSSFLLNSLFSPPKVKIPIYHSFKSILDAVSDIKDIIRKAR
jgi:hypothetical protein